MVLIGFINTLLDFFSKHIFLKFSSCEEGSPVEAGQRARYTVDTWSLGPEAADEWTRGTATARRGCVLELGTTH